MRAAETGYAESVWLLELVCRVTWFDDFQTSVWVQHYGNLQSVEAIAEHLNTTESRVLCVLNNVSPDWNFSIGVDRLQKAQKTLAAECEILQHPKVKETN